MHLPFSFHLGLIASIPSLLPSHLFEALLVLLITRQYHPSSFQIYNTMQINRASQVHSQVFFSISVFHYFNQAAMFHTSKGGLDSTYRWDKEG